MWSRDRTLCYWVNQGTHQNLRRRSRSSERREEAPQVSPKVEERTRSSLLKMNMARIDSPWSFKIKLSLSKDSFQTSHFLMLSLLHINNLLQQKLEASSWGSTLVLPMVKRAFLLWTLSEILSTARLHSNAPWVGFKQHLYYWILGGWRSKVSDWWRLIFFSVLKWSFHCA